MKFSFTENNEFVPDIVGTQCIRPFSVKDVEFKVRCGKCLPCLKRRRNEWGLRLEHEDLDSDSALFITLTYNDIYLPKYWWKNRYKKEQDPVTKKWKVVKRWKERVYSSKPTLNNVDLQKYIKRIRIEHDRFLKRNSTEKLKLTSKKVRYFACGEYGAKGDRPHYHILLFNYDISNLAPLENKWSKMGFVDIKPVNGNRIMYTAKYMMKPWSKSDDRQRPFSTMSKKPIIGHSYLEKYGVHHIENEVIETADIQGNQRRLPKAYLRRLFTNKEDRKELCLKSYSDYQDAKAKKYKQKLEEHFNGDSFEYAQSIEEDLKRRLLIINNSEQL
jgi:hypothetical protein